MNKYFLITVDTEGDNLWGWKHGATIETQNAKYIPRFQDLCEKYGFVPTYFVNYEMALDHFCCEYLTGKSLNKKCEIGMHLHAWNTPPDYSINNRYNGLPYITEYPSEIIFDKHKYLRGLINDKFSVAPVTYRSGRWSTDDRLFQILEELGFLSDCSITPEIKHLTNGSTVRHGSFYTRYDIYPRKLCGNLIEIPTTTRSLKTWQGETYKNRIKNLVFGKKFWLRPAVQTLSEMLMLKEIIEDEEIGYLDFMIHSSELMPGGSPYTKSSDDVEEYYRRMEQFFIVVSEQYQGTMVKDYAKFLLQCDKIK